MSFFLFKLIFGALVLGFLAVLGLIGRQVWQKRRPTPSPAAAGSTRPRLPRLGRPAEPAPVQAEGPPPARRRQLRSLSELEASDAPVPAPAAPPPPHALLARLEQAFERLESGEIALSDYETQVRAEQAEIERQIAARSASGEEEADALAALETTRWCLDWVGEQRRQRSA